MKKYLKGILSFAIAMIVLPFGVNAADISQADFDAAIANPGTFSNGVGYSSDAADYYLEADGTYTLTSNINLDGHALFLTKTITLDLNGNTISTVENVYSPLVAVEGSTANVTITGAGTISADWVSVGAYGEASLTIENGTYNGSVEVEGAANVTIKNGTFTSSSQGAINFKSAGTATINNGTFTGNNGISAMYIINSEGSININGGTFVGSEDCGIEQGGSTTPTITITGGTFTGKVAGIGFESATVKLSSGTFKAIDDDKGGLRLSGGTADTMNSWLVDGYEYSPTLATTTGEYGFVYSQKEIKVINPNATEETPATTTTGTSTTTTSTETKKIEVLNGADQKYDATSSDRLRFRFDVPLATFKQSGKVFYDGKEVASNNYDLEEGSTIVIFTKAFTDKLKAGNHTIKITTAEGEAEANFTVSKAVTNPQTGDNIMTYVGLAIISGLSLVFVSKKRFN